MFEFFKRNRSAKNPQKKPRAVAFVDFEHWYISLDRMHHTRPDIKAWRDELSAKFEMTEIIFFADFSNPALRLEIPKIRAITNYIIETQNTSSNFKKDFTDFIMLDHIYQKAMNSRDIDTFILFSGDGHFNSVVNYLVTQLGKTVGIYGIKDAMSNQLRATASWVVLLPKEDDPKLQAYRMVLKNLKYLFDNATEKKKARPTFWATAEAVSRINHVPKQEITDALRSMLEKGYIYQTEEKINNSKSVKVIHVDWEKCRRSGIWSEND